MTYRIDFRQYAPLLIEVPLFQGLDDEQTRRALSAAHLERCEQGAFFFMEGDPGEKCYLLVEGKVRLLQVTAAGQQVILNLIGPGTAFGLIAALSEIEYPVSAQALEPAQALAWHQPAMAGLLSSEPPIAFNAMRILVGHIRDYQSRIRELSTQRVERRLAHTLLRLAQATGRKVEQGVLIDLPLTRQDLAEMSGTTLYTVSRTLRQWEAEGLVLSRREQVIIVYPHGLVRIAEDLNHTA